MVAMGNVESQKIAIIPDVQPIGGITHCSTHYLVSSRRHLRVVVIPFVSLQGSWKGAAMSLRKDLIAGVASGLW